MEGKGRKAEGRKTKTKGKDAKERLKGGRKGRKEKKYIKENEEQGWLERRVREQRQKEV